MKFNRSLYVKKPPTQQKPVDTRQFEENPVLNISGARGFYRSELTERIPQK
jgi:hypothetical protein